MSLLFVKRVIDSLSEQYKQTITIQQTREPSVDASTGDITSPVDDPIVVKKAIVLPEDLSRHFYSSTEVDTVDLYVYVSLSNLPSEFVFSKNNVISIDEKVYDIVSWEKFLKYAIVIKLKRLG